MKTMLCEIGHSLTDLAHNQLNNLDEVNTKEMDHVIHMIKNITEAIYYCSIVEAMENGTDTTKIAINTATNGVAAKA